MSEDNKFYQLVHPGGPKGLLTEKPEMQEQAKEFELQEYYAVVFFPKITGIGGPYTYNILRTLSNSPEAAIAKYMDGLVKGETWETYEDAGYCVRKVKLTDLGNAE